MKVLTFNARVWTRDTDKSSDRFWRKRMEAMKAMILDLNPDIICFQELSYPACTFVPNGYKRIGLTVSHPIYVKKGYDTKKHSFKIHMDYVIVDGIQVVNVHSRWESNVIARNCEQVKKITAADMPTVVCGDFNNEADKITLFPMVRANMIPMQDTFINFDRPTESHGIIDHFYTKNIAVKSCTLILNGYGVPRLSDHYPVLLEF